MAASPVYGHFAPLKRVAAFLAGRGHDVTLLSHEQFRPMAGENVRYEAFTGEAGIDVEQAHAEPERLAIPAGPERFAWDMRNIFVKAVAPQFRDVQRILAEAGDEPVVLIYETAFLGAAPSLLGAPGPRPAATIGLGPVAFTLSSVDTAPFGMGLAPDSSEEGRARHREANAFMQEQLLGPAQGLFEQTLAELGVTAAEIPFFLDSPVLNADLFLQMSVEELSYMRSDTPAHVRFIGTLPPADAGGELPEWWPEVEAAERVVVVTQGTIANQDFGELIEPALDGLASFPGLVIAATGRPGEVRNVPANARVTEFVPFDELLPHADVFVTNGGFGAVQQSLRNGVPMVAAGLSEEKLESNVRLAATGAAVNLASQRAAPAEIRKAVEEVVATASYRNNARRLAADYAAVDAFGEIERALAELTHYL
ncbi:glycosyl transferase [Streptomyces fuscichromogenes]|uniref:Glycosyl transferase n=1 Tax=Streptomyces fuscichromogenes TaxID=1324013 RepID=A0A917XPP8_9ACTN|nr:glycosyl transferase [Streptomyces fuscichromogenes]